MSKDGYVSDEEMRAIREELLCASQADTHEVLKSEQIPDSASPGEVELIRAAVTLIADVEARDGTVAEAQGAAARYLKAVFHERWKEVEKRTFPLQSGPTDCHTPEPSNITVTVSDGTQECQGLDLATLGHDQGFRWYRESCGCTVSSRPGGEPSVFMCVTHREVLQQDQKDALVERGMQGINYAKGAP